MRKSLALAFSTLLVLLIFPFGVFAQSSDVAKVTVLGSEEVVEGDYFATGDSVEIYGTVNGDVYAAAGQVIVDGVVNGDLLVGGGSVSIRGEVTQDVRAGAGQLDISGTIGRNLTFGAGEVSILESATIAGSIVGGGGTVIISAPVGGNMKIGAGDLTVSNTVNGNIDAGVERLRLAPQANIQGDVVYWSENDASIDQTATVSGQITRKVGAPAPVHEDNRPWSEAGRGMWIYWVLASLVTGFAFVHFLPKAVQLSADALEKQMSKSFGVGVLALIVTPILSVLLMVTVIGIPLAVTLLVLYALLIYFTRFVVMIVLGKMLLKKLGKEDTLKLSFVAGLVVLGVLRLVPVVTIFIGLLTTVFGLGAMLLAAKEKR